MNTNEIFLFDVDGTIAESGKKISNEMGNLLNIINKDYSITIGIVGGGKYEKIIEQLDNKIKPTFIFSECGSVYHHLDNLIYKNELRKEEEYEKINILVKIALKFISETDYLVSGNFIDLRNGLIYISLVGMSANDEERNNFIKLDKIYFYRNNLLEILCKKAIELNINDSIDINLGGSVGIGIYPKKWNKTQILNTIDPITNVIYYFGDKYEPNGNDYELITHPNVKGFPVNSPEETIEIIKKYINLKTKRLILT